MAKGFFSPFSFSIMRVIWVALSWNFTLFFHDESSVPCCSQQSPLWFSSVIGPEPCLVPSVTFPLPKSWSDLTGSACSSAQKVVFLHVFISLQGPLLLLSIACCGSCPTFSVLLLSLSLSLFLKCDSYHFPNVLCCSLWLLEILRHEQHYCLRAEPCCWNSFFLSPKNYNYNGTTDI